MRAYSLVGVDGNAFSVMAYVKDAMREAEFGEEEVSEYVKDAMSGTYDKLLCLSVEKLGECNERLGLEEEFEEEEEEEFAEEDLW